MKNIRFYLEYNSPKDKRENHNNGNVIAIYPKNKTAIGVESLKAYLNYGVVAGFASPNYLRTKCKRISEDIARIIHPKLFEVL